jgi:hypothetical protein
VGEQKAAEELPKIMKKHQVPLNYHKITADSAKMLEKLTMDSEDLLKAVKNRN